MPRVRDKKLSVRVVCYACNGTGIQYYNIGQSNQGFSGCWSCLGNGFEDREKFVRRRKGGPRKSTTEAPFRECKADTRSLYSRYCDHVYEDYYCIKCGAPDA